MRNPFRYFNSSPEVIRITVIMYIRCPLSLRQVEDILFERGIDICHETVRYRKATNGCLRQKWKLEH
jgi:putative transposase